MAFNTLLALMNYECKIRQEGIHTWSEIWLALRSQSDRTVAIIAKVDNTFDSIDWQKAISQNKAEWNKDYGSGRQIRWYNKMAKSKQQKQAVRAITVSNKVVKRIEDNIKIWLNHYSLLQQ